MQIWGVAVVKITDTDAILACAEMKNSNRAEREGIVGEKENKRICGDISRKICRVVLVAWIR
jgi:hypothetical protein